MCNSRVILDLPYAACKNSSNFAPDKMALACFRASTSSSRAVCLTSKFHHKVARLMQLCIVVRQLLQLQHHSLLGLLSFNEFHFCLGFQFALVCNLLALCLNGGICFLHEIFICLLSILF